jgi:hypothetical protein
VKAISHLSTLSDLAILEQADSVSHLIGQNWLRQAAQLGEDDACMYI